MDNRESGRERRKNRRKKKKLFQNRTEKKLDLFQKKKKKLSSVVDPDRPEAVDLRDVRVVAKLGGTVDDSELVDGLVFDQRSARGAGGPTRVENAKIALIQFCLSPPKTDLDNSVVVSDYAAMDRVLRDERNHVLG